jgi:GNAT superfamily N-acetyltransferase
MATGAQTTADPTSYALEFFDDPAACLAAGAAYFEARPVEANVITVMADRCAREGRPPGLPHFWFVLVRAGAEVVGAAMRSAPFTPYPLYVAPMPDEAARLLGRTLAARGEDPGGANGSLPAARLVAEEAAALLCRQVQVAMPTRLWELGTLLPPAGVPGRPRLAGPPDEELCLGWLNGFRRAADEQAGRTAPSQAGEAHTRDDVRARIAERRIVLWEVAGEVVHLTGVFYPVFGVGRIGPVYTPEEHRGHGYAAAAVAYGSQLILDAGGRATLFTDLENPVSNGVYARLGYLPAFDTANHTLV